MRLNVPENFANDIALAAKTLKRVEEMMRTAKEDREIAQEVVKNVISNYGSTIVNKPKFYINVPNSSSVIEILNFEKKALDTKELKKQYPDLVKEFEYTTHQQRITVKDFFENDNS